MHAILPHALSAILVASTAGAFQNGNGLLRYCQSGTEGDNVCIAYIMGVADTFESLRAFNSRPHCSPSGVTGKQIRDVVVQYLEKNPARRDETGPSLVIEAMVAAWCPMAPQSN